MNLPCATPKNLLDDPSCERLIADIRAMARQAFDDARGSHDWEHTLRVVDLCDLIGPEEGADMLVVKAAAYLHDIGRADQDRARGSICHAEEGARRAALILAPLPLETERKANIVHCIQAHRFRNQCAPATIEAKVLYDADKLDAIGAVGIARAYLFAGELGARLHNPDLLPEQAPAYSREDTGDREYVVKLSKIKDRVLTSRGRRLAEERHAFMTAFFDRFLAEIAGRC